MQYRKTALFFLIILWALNSFVVAQERIRFEHLSLEDGLSQTTVNAILQDNKGFLWFATLDGLNRYDGYNFKVYRQSAKKGSIPDNSINCLFEDKDKNIWIGINKTGLAKYISYKDEFRLFDHTDTIESSISNNNVTDIIQDNDGLLWIATDYGLNSLNIKTIKFNHFFTKDGLHSDLITSLAYDKKNNRIWIGTEKGLCVYDKKTKKIYKVLKNIKTKIYDIAISTDNNLWLSSDFGVETFNIKNIDIKHLHNIKTKKIIPEKYKVRIFKEDYLGKIWMGTFNNGIIIYDNSTQKYRVLKNDPLDPYSISVNTILSLFEDESHIMWIGTSLGGVNKYNRTAKAFETYRNNPSNPNSLSSDQVRSIYEDNKGYIWIGTKYGGLNKWDRKNNTFIHYTHDFTRKNSLQDNYVRYILQDKNGDFYISTDTAGIAKFDPEKNSFKHYKHNDNDTNSLSNNQVWRMLIDSKNNFWVATFGGGLDLFDKKTGKFKHFKHKNNDSTSISGNKITSVFEDSNGNLWVGTYDNGLNKFDYKTHKFKHIRIAPKENKVDRIYCIIEDSEGFIWLGTRGYLVKLNPENLKITRYYYEDYGFPNHVLMSIIEDNTGNLWVATNNGLAKFDKHSLKVRNYYESDGLQSNEFMIGAYYRTNDGMFMFGGVKGLNTFYPEEIKDNPHKPKVVITGIKVLNKDIETDTVIAEKKVITLDYNSKAISFEFVALDFGASKMNKYAYKLEGFDNDWIDAGTRRFASYTNLSPKVYKFRVKAANNDGVWNDEGASILIIIKPPFWQKTWFVAVSTLIILILIYFIIRLRDVFRDKHKLLKLVEQRTLEVRQQKEEIESQLEQIENQRNRLQKAYQDIKILNEIGQKITANLEIKEIINTINNLLDNLLETEVFGVGIYDEVNRWLSWEKVRYKNNFLERFKIKTSDATHPVIICFTQKQDIIIHNYKYEYNRFSQEYKPLHPEIDTNSIIYMPITVKGETIGVITVQHSEQYKYKNHHISLFRNIALHTSIAMQNAEAYNKIQRQKQGITDSIRYAQRIQAAILPPRTLFDQTFDNYFILFLPRDIVSGDFYWMAKRKIDGKNKIFVAAADCTGHGVPGAFMSMLGISMLNEILNRHTHNTDKTKISAGHILTELRKAVIEALHQTGKIGEPQDGMDIALLIFDFDEMIMEFAGANNPVILVRKDDKCIVNEKTILPDKNNDTYNLFTVKGDKMPISIFMEKNTPFTNKIIKIKKDDRIYIFSDGFIDQFGGREYKKFKIFRFKELILKLQDIKPFENQKEKMNNTLENWKNRCKNRKIEQTDDILVMGFKI